MLIRPPACIDGECRNVCMEPLPIAHVDCRLLYKTKGSYPLLHPPLLLPCPPLGCSAWLPKKECGPLAKRFPHLCPKGLFITQIYAANILVAKHTVKNWGVILWLNWMLLPLPSNCSRCITNYFFSASSCLLQRLLIAV